MPGYLTFEKEKEEREREKKARRRISVFPAFSPRRLIFRINGHREPIDASLSRINYVLLNHALSSSDPDKCVKPKIMRMMLRDSIFFFFLPPPQCTGCAILICFSRKSCPIPSSPPSGEIKMFGQESNGLQWMGFFLKLNSYRIITIIYFQGNIIYFESPCTQPREIHANAPFDR